MSPELVDRIVLVVALALCGVVGILAAWVGRLEERIGRAERQAAGLRRAVGPPMGQRETPLESTDGTPRPASLSREAAEAGVSGEGRPELPVPVRIISPERAKRSLEQRFAAKARLSREVGGRSAS